MAEMSMNLRILSHLEEKQVKAFLKEDGQKNLNLRVLVLRARRSLPEIRRELALLEKFVRAYDKRRNHSDS
jgi:hypothetical protein